MIKKILQLTSNMGLRYTTYRIWHELEKKLGVLKKRHPINPRNKTFVSLEEWKALAIPFVVQERECLQFEKIKDAALSDAALKIIKGQLCFFNADWKNLGKQYDWITNPETGYQYDVSKHWSEISDFNSSNGDIKYVWEKSRFSYLLTIMRYDYHFEQDNAAFVFAEIESWIDANPINQGPNWKCSQEISLRLFNWLYLLNFYKNSTALTEAIWGKIQQVIYWSLHHVYHHIDFSRIAVRNNHAITETLALTLSELLFPFIPESKKWATNGRKWFEREVAYQVYDDGTFLQFSMNYHRVITQLFSFGISITELHQKPFSKQFYEKVYKSLNFLYQCLQEENGFLPNYGANDGALFFPLTNTAYRDYRAQLNSLHCLLTNQKLYDEVTINEELNWLQKISNAPYEFKKLEKEFGTISFPIGGYYICRTPAHFTFIRCGNHKDRPSHADNLHMDLWANGENIIRDSGTYKYNTTKELTDYFTGSTAHNTVVINNESQMLKGSRFIWYFWSQCIKANWQETKGEYVFNGKIKAFQQLNPKATHSRTIKINKLSAAWTVIDEVFDLDNYTKEQVWHLDDFPINFNVKSNEVKVNAENKLSYDSTYYGLKKKGKALSFEFNQQIETLITYLKN